jgi:bifunctional oligoribonuclease and PAP phosphatase NrnA
MNTNTAPATPSAPVAPGVTAPGWTSNIDVPAAAKWLRGAKSVVLLTHAKPDGDAAGSTLAMARTLIACGIDATIFYVSPVPRWLPIIAGDTPYQVLEASAKRNQPALAAMNPDAVVITDTGSWTQLDETREWIAARRDRTLVIDHHLHGDAEVSRHKILGIGEASATLVLAPLCCELLKCPASTLPQPIAEAIYLGMGTDTQWFKLSNVSPKALRLAADLMEAGVDHTRLYELIEQQDAAARWKLLGCALTSLELHHHGRVAIMQLSLKDFGGCRADRNDTSGFADMVLHIASVQVAVVLTEADFSPDEPPVTKVSMRSKPGPDAVDVNRITMSLGGGGASRRGEDDRGDAGGGSRPGSDGAARRVSGQLATFWNANSEEAEKAEEISGKRCVVC